MTENERRLLLKDLCARQFYGTKVLGPWEKDGPCELSAIDLTSSRQIRVFEDWFKIEEVKPYLRPLSNMTKEEKSELQNMFCYGWNYKDEGIWDFFNHHKIYGADAELLIDWLNEHHFDYRIDPSTGKTLIESGLAFEAPEGMYN